MVNAIVYSVISRSRILDSAAYRFSAEVPRLAMVCPRRFWYAPNMERSEETLSIAVSISEIPWSSDVCDQTLIPLDTAPKPSVPPARVVLIAAPTS